MAVAQDAVPALWARLPAGGWQVGCWVDAGGRALVEVTDPLGTLAHRAASARHATLSVAAGWAGCSVGPGGEQQCWALAIGHAPAGAGHLVSFAQRSPGTGLRRMTLPPEAPSGLWMVHDGLWVAAVAGCYTHVRLTARSALHVYPLHPVTQ